MGYVIRLGKHLKVAIVRCRFNATEHSAFFATVNRLSDAERLPQAMDLPAMIPPTTQAFVRRVAPSINLWLWFVVRDSHVSIVTVVRTPPVPFD